MKIRSAFTIFHFWYQKMIFSFFSYGSCPRSRSRTKMVAVQCRLKKYSIFSRQCDAANLCKGAVGLFQIDENARPTFGHLY